jgi:hypothetical protein
VYGSLKALEFVPEIDLQANEFLQDRENRRKHSEGVMTGDKRGSTAGRRSLGCFITNHFSSPKT